jgi:hypothetical protein
MSLNDSIDALATGTYTVTRRVRGSYTDGVYSGPGTTTTFTISAVQEPATGLQRVTGGDETRSDEQGRRTNDIRVLYTRTELFAETSGYEPDLVTINGRQYSVWRCEPWDLAYYEASNEVHYRALATRVTQGSM